jgi:hypothetical protein
MSRGDRAAEVAEFLDTDAVGLPETAILVAVVRRWPDLSRDEYLRALDIAIELRRATLAGQRMGLHG